MNETGVKSETELVLRRLSDAFPYASPEANAYCWWALTIGVLLLGMFFVAWMYRRDSKSCHWYVAVPLALLRMCVYGLLAFAFLLPAKQTWETSEKRSRVILLLDISPSVTQISDDVSRGGGAKPKFRIEKVIDFLTDDKVAFLKKLLDRNPVFVYRFGTRLDEDAQSFKAEDAAAWTSDDWAAWTRYDFKPWVLKVLSPAGRDIVTKTNSWNGAEPGTAEWAVAWVKLPETETVPATLTPADSTALKDAIKKLEARVDVARSIIQGTDLPDSLAAAINRESSNMAQAVIVISDGRSNLGSEGELFKLRDRPGEKIPVFTIAVGEPRENVSIVITDLQVPDRVPPDEPSKILIEADGIGLEKQEVDVKVGLYLPSRDPKKDSPDHEIPAKIKFEPGEPPHGRVEIVIDPDTLPEGLTEEVKKDGGKRKQLKQGAWNVVARIPRDKREVYANEFHVSPPRVLNVIDSPLRVLLWASGPTREYQTLRTMLMREVNEKRAEMSIFLQNEGAAGNIVQDVSPERLLVKYPTRYVIGGPSTPEDKFYNLNEYDLIIAFDPDWSELSPEQIDMTKRWVMDGGGGFIYVAGTINTHQLARADDAGRLKPLLEMMPVLPEDGILAKARAVPRSPRRTLLKPNPDFDILKLDDTDPADPIAGWETFFTGKAKYTPDPDMKKNLNPTRGFFSYYPVKLLKPGAAVLMEFLDTNDTGVVDPKPYLVCSQPGKGRAAFLASGEMYRMRFPEPSYYDRFWIRFARAMSSARRNVQSFRGQVLVNKEYTSGSMIRVATRLVAPNNLPYPVNGITPKFKVEQYEGANKIKEFGPFPLSEKKTSAAFDGYYQAQVLADPRQFPAGEYRYKVVVEVPDSSGDTISGEFMVRKSNPELDNTRPDFAALQNAASSLEEIKAGIKNAGVVEKLRGTATNDAQVKMAFKLAESDKLATIPECIEAKFVSIRNRGAVDDLWDKGFELDSSVTERFDKRVGGSRTVSYLLLAAVALLGIEWLTRKLVRLA